MRYLLSIFFILAVLCNPAYAIMFVSGAGYSDIIFWAGFEDSTTLEASNCNSGTDTSWTLRQSATIINTVPLDTGTGYYLLADASGRAALISIASGDYINYEKGAIVVMFNISDWVNSQKFFRISDASDYTIVLNCYDGDDIQAIWYPQSTEISISTSGAGANSGTFYAVLRWDSTANTMDISVFNTSGVLQGTAGTSTAAMTEMSGLATSTLTVGDASYMAVYGKYDKLVIFDGSIPRTAQQYCDIVRDNTSCPN